MSTDYLIWDPSRGQTRDGSGQVYPGNTPKEAGIAFVRDDYADLPRTPEERLLRVERLSDGLTWDVHLEPVVVTNWRGVASVVLAETAPDHQTSCDPDPLGGFSGR